ncbi:hypothetical protein QF035_002989 [Streptomyces umbrinus]|uniref:Uncharacterized protein n=1 Tax=Streptomyces umbrinus TaxID=67370 RepID=A0ABU0SPH8_9ACTN|nr:hypothetical protein [Streptomyces umbrinus]
MGLVALFGVSEAPDCRVDGAGRFRAAIGHRTGFGHQDSARQVLRDVACTRTRTMTTVLREPVRHGGCVEVGDEDGTVWAVRRQGEEPE